MKILFFANTDWYLYNFRLALAEAMRGRGNEVVLVSPEGAYASRLQEMGFRWICFPMKQHGLNPLFEISTILRLIKLYRQEKPELVHHFTIKCVLYGSMTCRLLGILPVVNSVTGLGYAFSEGQGARRWLRRFILLLNRIVLRPTWVIFQNPDDQATYFESKLVNPGRVALIRGSGVDIRRFVPIPEPDGSPVVVLPARLLWDKGVGEFVEAARRLQADEVRARFILVGDSDPETPAAVPISQIQEWVKMGVIEWWGWQDDMNAVYAQAHIVCLPSYYREGVPKSLIEAAACGRPLIAGNAPGCREIVRPGENGFLVPVRDIDALEATLRQLIQDPALRHTMGMRGRIISEEEFSMDLVIEQTLKVYQSATGKEVEEKA